MIMVSDDSFALVPYNTVYKKKSFLSSLFESRKSVYYFLAAAGFFAYCLALCIGLEHFGYEADFIQFSLLLILVSFASSFTVFSPAVAFVGFAGLCFFCGLYFKASLLLSAFLLCGLVYFTEIFKCFCFAKYGLMAVFKPHNFFRISVATLIFCIFTLIFYNFR